jgi:hypothetical protein
MATRQPAKPRKTTQLSDAAGGIPPQEMRRRIEIAAYYKAQERGFAPGHELDDWIAAEAEVRRGMDASAG